MDLGSRAPATAARRRLNRSRASHPLTVNQAYAQRVPKHRSLSSDGMRTSSARTCPENGLDRSLDCPENGLDRSLDRSLAPPAPRSPTRRLAPLAWIRMRPQQRRGEARVPRDESHGSIWIGVTERVVARPTRCLSGVYPMLWRTPIPFLGLPVAVDRSCRSAAGPLQIPGLLLVKHDDRILPKPHGERRHTRFGAAGRTIEGGRHTVAPQQSACRPAADDLPGQEFDPITDNEGAAFHLPPKRALIEISQARRRLPRGQTISKIEPIAKADFLQPPRYHVGRLVELAHSGAIDVGLEAKHRQHLKAEGYKS